MFYSLVQPFLFLSRNDERKFRPGERYLPNDTSDVKNTFIVHRAFRILHKKRVLVFAYGLSPHFSQKLPNYELFVEILNRDFHITVVTFDYRGIGSEQLFCHSSLATRLEDLRAVFSWVRFHFPMSKVWLGGHSAGATLAARLSGELDLVEEIDGLVVSAPAAYHPDAWFAQFGKKFSGVIREERSWEGSHEFGCFGQFRGRKEMILCSGDEVIPPGVLDGYKKNLGKRGQLTTLVHSPDGHRIFSYREKTEHYAKLVGEMMTSR